MALFLKKYEKGILKFMTGNAKLSKDTLIFDLPAGHACPFALNCLAKTSPVTGRLTDGKETQFRCFAATGEALSPQARNLRWHNFNTLRSLKTDSQMVEVILNSIKAFGKIDKIAKVRVHASGDFFSEAYFRAWMTVAKTLPHIVFYAYTKSLPYWVNSLELVPDNFKLNASKGGKFDHLISEHNLKYVEVVHSEAEAKKKKLKVDHNDSFAWAIDKSFALLIHGTQPAGTEASKAMQKLRVQGVNGYSRKKLQTA